MDGWAECCWSRPPSMQSDITQATSPDKLCHKAVSPERNNTSETGPTKAGRVTTRVEMGVSCVCVLGSETTAQTGESWRRGSLKEDGGPLRI